MVFDPEWTKRDILRYIRRELSDFEEMDNEDVSSGPAWHVHTLRTIDMSHWVHTNVSRL